MKRITPLAHGYLDYLTVVLFLAAPTVLGFGGIPAMLAWLLAAVHLAMTLITDFPLGLIRRLPFSIHGWVERIVGPALLAVAFLPDFHSVQPAFAFFAAMGLIIVAVGWLTHYSDAPASTLVQTR
ncbi:hypothetical protein [Methylocystis parvus]|uniref:SPW repeat protein n=1 Tax=Methylocystis parvus TaxID=134 RepID=A0A6B8M3J2_9HYPH|nr:hypothetical protein [Methylocystis parvus]QGM97461.1 hypothetical protein F7D14_08280 [Methylocystis parvus]WBJ98620.1 hypothetical protein MMG94_11320 [Methylocystis parvus OBBP]